MRQYSGIWADGIRVTSIPLAAEIGEVAEKDLRDKMKRARPGVEFQMKGHSFIFDLVPENDHEQATKEDYKHDSALAVYEEMDMRMRNAIARIHTLEAKVKRLEASDEA